MTPNFHSITKLILFTNPLGDKTITTLADTFKHLPSLANLSLQNCDFSYVGLESIANQIHYITNLTILALDSINTTPVSNTLIMKKIGCLEKLIEFHYRSNQVRTDEFKIFCNTLSKLTSLEMLCFSDNKIEDEGIVYLSKCIDSVVSLSTIEFKMNNIGDDGFIALVNAFEYLPWLHTINMKGIYIYIYNILFFIVYIV